MAKSPTPWPDVWRRFVGRLIRPGESAPAAELGAQREAARLIREAEARFRTLFSASPFAISIVRDHNYLFANRAHAKLFGVEDPEKLVGRSVWEFLGAEDRAKLEQTRRAPQQEGEVRLYEGTAWRDDGSCFEFQTQTALIALEDGPAQLVFLFDVTERKSAERERDALLLRERETLQRKEESLDALETERSRFEAILQQMPSAVLMGEAATGQVMLGNQQVAKIWRLPLVLPFHLGGDTAYQGFKPEGSPLTAADWPLARSLRLGEIIAGEEIEIRRGDGSMGVIRVNSTPIRDRDGRITAAVMVFDDITERARADGAQRFLAETGSSLVGSLDENDVWARLARLCVPRIADWCAILLFEQNNEAPEVTLTQANMARSQLAQKFREYLMTDAEVPWTRGDGRDDTQVFLYNAAQNLPLKPFGNKMHAILEEMGARSVVVAPLAARGRVAGVMIWIAADSGRVLDAQDMALAEELARRAALTADNARLYRASEVAVSEAHAARDEAQNANRAKDEFLAVVSHELRTPLTPILGWIELLRGAQVDDESRRHAYDVIERNARAQAQIVNDILDVSRITTGKLRLEMRPVDLNGLVERAIDSLRTNLVSKKLELNSRIDAVGQVAADAGRMQQVIWNLLQNAVKFTPEGGRIEVVLQRVGDRAELAVSDNGIGIAAQFLPHVFDQFRQADSSASRPSGGLGLGLAIVRHIVELHGGQAWVASEGEGYGSRFYVSLPIKKFVGSQLEAPRAPEASVETSPPEVEADAPPEAGAGPTGEIVSEMAGEAEAAQVGDTTQAGEGEACISCWDKEGSETETALEGIEILLVDDEDDTRAALSRLLESSGARVRAAASGGDALRLLEDWRPQLVITDIGMPFMDGYELRSNLRVLFADVPAVALTGYAASADRQRATEAGFEGYLTKPVSAADLVHVSRQVLGL